MKYDDWLDDQIRTGIWLLIAIVAYCLIFKTWHYFYTGDKEDEDNDL